MTSQMKRYYRATQRFLHSFRNTNSWLHYEDTSFFMARSKNNISCMHAFVLQESPSAGFDTLFEPLSPEEDFLDMPDDGANDEVLYQDLFI